MKAFRMTLIVAILVAAVLDGRVQSDWPARVLHLSFYLVAILIVCWRLGWLPRH